MSHKKFHKQIYYTACKPSIDCSQGRWINKSFLFIVFNPLLCGVATYRLQGNCQGSYVAKVSI